MMRGDVDPFAAMAAGAGSSSAVPSTSRDCAFAQCGGGKFCVHRFADARAFADGAERAVRDAVHAWRVYDMPPPYTFTDERAARNVIAELLRARATVDDMHRCGANAEQLALLGVAFHDLVYAHDEPGVARYTPRALIDGLHLDWQRMHSLSFHVDLLRDRVAFPFVHFVDRPLDMCAAHFADFPLTHAYLMRVPAQEPGTSLHLTSTEIAALGFDAPLLVSLGARGVDLLFAFIAEDTSAAKFRSNMQLTLPLFDSLLGARAPSAETHKNAHRAWTELHSACERAA